MTLSLFMQLGSVNQSMFTPGGLAASKITTLGWIVFMILLVVTAIMFAMIIVVAVRRKGTFEEHGPAEPEGGQSFVFGAILVTLAILTTIFVVNIESLSGFPADKPAADPPPEIVVYGHQWWWEVQYVNGPPYMHFATANEIHIPVGEPVNVQLISDNVAHSFWIPALNGKEDLIPGQENYIQLRADKPGIYRGQCAEFCGAEHAHMIILVVAQDRDDYEAWAAQQRQAAANPTSDEQKEGEQLFVNGPCAFCHTVRGTGAAGSVAPDLTHIASRQGIAANTLPNTKANLEAWITHAQSIKPEAKMPNLTEFDGLQLRALVAYLQNLQ